MKKLLPFILIVFISLGFFFPLFYSRAIEAGTPCTLADGKPGVWVTSSGKFICQANASSPGASQDPLGTCILRITDSKGTRTVATYIGKTSTECQLREGYMSWVATPGVLKNPSWTPVMATNPEDLLGTCKTTTYGTFSSIVSSLPGVKISACPAHEGKDFSREWIPDNSLPDTIYHFLAPLPCEEKSSDGCVKGLLQTFNPASDPNGPNTKIGDYLNIVIKLFIGICSVLAVIMVVIGGIEYMTSELPGNKEQGKQRIEHAVWGLILALGAWTILYTINPDLLNTDLSSLTNQTVNVDLGAEGVTPFNVSTGSTQLQSAGINCPKTGGVNSLSAIGQSFIGHSSYSMEKRNTTSGSTAYVDCSSFVSQVYSCAGLPNPGNTTSSIFSSGTTRITDVDPTGTSVILNGTSKLIKVGDLLGWKQGEDDGEGVKEANGHVVLYIGNGKVIDAQGPGVAIRSLNSAQFEGRIKYWKPGP